MMRESGAARSGVEAEAVLLREAKHQRPASAKQRVRRLHVGIVQSARMLDPGVDRVASMRAETLEDRRDRSRTWWCTPTGGELRGANLKSRDINRGARDWILGIHERTDVC